jgi:opacity protein-like surface antigen
MTTSSIVQRLCFPALVALLLLPFSAAAQPVPAAGQVAAGVELGVFPPTDSQLSAGVVGGGLLEVYATPRIGVRGTVTAMRSGYARFDNDTERQVRLGLDVIYNWERGAVHPFVGGGVGMHFLRFHRDGRNVGPNDTQFGTQALGGVEFFLNRAWALKAEGRYQWVGDRPNLNPDGLALTIGAKRYF